jgi:hypothetical protein
LYNKQEIEVGRVVLRKAISEAGLNTLFAELNCRYDDSLGRQPAQAMKISIILSLFTIFCIAE